MTEQGYRAAEASRNLGINSSNLRRWIIEYRSESEQSTTDKVQQGDDQARIKAIEKEVKRLRMERDILKKAVAIFSEDPR